MKKLGFTIERNKSLLHMFKKINFPPKLKSPVRWKGIKSIHRIHFQKSDIYKNKKVINEERKSLCSKFLQYAFIIHSFFQ